jgi:lysophospholipase L1-like esterase
LKRKGNGKGEVEVKRSRFGTRRLLALSLVVVGGMSACGYLVSVPQLRNADNNEIVNIGDSIFALSGDIYDELHAKAGETWRHYAVSGTQMIGGILGPPIPMQYQIARNDDPNIRVVYLDGGGNDILLQAIMGDPYGCKRCNYWWCGDISRTCKGVIEDVAVEGSNLLNQMAADGVEQVVMVGYYYTTWGIFVDLRKLKKAVDYGAALTISGISNSNANAVYVDPRGAFSGHESQYITIDGIHPTSSGSAVLADMIWDVIDY